jgi:hypothetical protein
MSGPTLPPPAEPMATDVATTEPHSLFEPRAVDEPPAEAGPITSSPAHPRPEPIQNRIGSAGLRAAEPPVDPFYRAEHLDEQPAEAGPITSSRREFARDRTSFTAEPPDDSLTQPEAVDEQPAEAGPITTSRSHPALGETGIAELPPAESPASSLFQPETADEPPAEAGPITSSRSHSRHRQDHTADGVESAYEQPAEAGPTASRRHRQDQAGHPMAAPSANGLFQPEATNEHPAGAALTPPRHSQNPTSPTGSGNGLFQPEGDERPAEARPRHRHDRTGLAGLPAPEPPAGSLFQPRDEPPAEAGPVTSAQSHPALAPSPEPANGRAGDGGLAASEPPAGSLFQPRDEPPAEAGPGTRSRAHDRSGLAGLPPAESPADSLFQPAVAPQEPPATPVQPGDVLRTVLVGLPLAGYLPLWEEDGVTFWRMKDPDAVRARLGAGVESRSEVDTRRYREAAMFSPSRGTLFMMDRVRDESGHLGGTSTLLEPATKEEAYAAVDDKAVSELYVWLGEVALASVQRGEFVAVETGGWKVPMRPVVLIMLRTDGREWHSVVETSPVPEGAPVWRDQQPVNGNTQVLASPATDQTVRASGLLTRFAVATWGMHPFQLGLSFGPNPTL